MNTNELKKNEIKKNYMKKKKFVRFYDDSPDNIADVLINGSIECIHVPRIKTHIGTYQSYIHKCGGWKLKSEDRDLTIILEQLKHSEEEMSDSLTIEMMSELRQWVRQHPKNTCKVIFDFDRVINHIEGIVAGTYAFIQKENLTISGLAKYHMGTKERLNHFRKTIDELIAHKCKIYVVTNNPGCKEETFIPVLTYIHPIFTKKTVHCSFRFANKLNCFQTRKLI